MTLKELKAGESAIVKVVGGHGALRQHFLDMGVIPGAEVTLVKFAPMGDPMELRIHGYELTLRLADAGQIEIEKVKAHISGDNISEKKGSLSGKRASDNARDKEKTAIEASEKSEQNKKRDKQKKPEKELRKYREHPGFGEEGIYHDPATENPLPEGTTLTFALAGNQNCGKTTLFNQLTGANQHVGNFPGVTVDRKSGAIKNNPSTEVVDLPGIYSLSPYTDEEIVSRRYILNEKPKGIINIVDATNIERNLYLTMQLIELDVPMVLAINMMDEMRSNGGAVRINDMEAMLGIPVVPISASKNEGVDELVRHAIHVAKYQERPQKQDFCDENENGGAVHRCIHGIMHLIADHAQKADIPIRFAANKIIEGDERVIKALELSDNEKEMVEHIIIQMEEERGLDRAAAMADMRFSFIEKLVRVSVIKPRESKERQRSEKIDRILTGRFTAIPAFIGIMGLIFFLTFNVFGAWLQELLESGVDYMTAKMEILLNSLKVNDVVHSLVIKGVFTGVGSVISFLPIIIILFFFLSLLEDTGYMARVAFVMDKPLRKLGLSGRSIVPLLIGFGCSVPGVMAGRTLPSERDRKLTITLIPFMSCTAKLPIYAFFTSIFFPKNGALVMIGLYIFGIIMGILTAFVSKKTIFRGEAVPFVMELPNYRMPGLKNVAQLLWDKAKDFLTRAFTVIFLASIVIWFLQSFNFSLQLVDNSKESMLASIAGLISPVFSPMGFGDWRITTSLMTGFMAKESVVSTLSVLFGDTGEILSAMSTVTALSLLAFCLLYTPCVAAVASVKRELGRKWAIAIVLFQCTIAWIAAFAVKLIFSIFLG